MNNTEARLVELETRLAYQEDTIKQLNDVIVQQAQDIQSLEKKLSAVTELMRGLKQQAEDGNFAIHAGPEVPPHY